MFTTIENRNANDCSPSLGCAKVSEPVVKSAVDAIISRMMPFYLDMKSEAEKNPELITDYKTSLNDDYKDIDNVSSQRLMNVREAQNMVSECAVIKKSIDADRSISVFFEKNMRFDVTQNQTLDQEKSFIRLSVSVKDIKEEGGDALDLLLSQLSREILPYALGVKRRFDVRLEKGFLSLEGESWKWHFDGKEAFKTSITVCFSNKENWSTHIAEMDGGGERPAKHGFLYDALNVLHRAPIPADLGREELTIEDYRLFIRYNDSHNKNRNLNVEKKPPIFSQLSNQPSRQIDLSSFLNQQFQLFNEQTPKAIDIFNFVHSQRIKQEVEASLKSHYKNLLNSIASTEATFKLPTLQLSELLTEQTSGDRQENAPTSYLETNNRSWCSVL